MALRVGIVPYLNTRPLCEDLPRFLPQAQFLCDVPSRLAQGLANGQIDVAIAPVVEWFRHPDWQLVSDACIACRGPVRSVKLFGRKPVDKIGTLAADVSSRTSVALTQVLLAYRFGVCAKITPFSLSESPEEVAADGVLLIGDRAMMAPEDGWAFVWDLGAEWYRWTGLPFVFAVWVARAGVNVAPLHAIFASARDHGLQMLREIAADHAPRIGWRSEDCLSYLTENLWFYLDGETEKGLEHFRHLAELHGLVPRRAVAV